MTIERFNLIGKQLLPFKRPYWMKFENNSRHERIEWKCEYVGEIVSDGVCSLKAVSKQSYKYVCGFLLLAFVWSCRRNLILIFISLPYLTRSLAHMPVSRIYIFICFFLSFISLAVGFIELWPWFKPLFNFAAWHFCSIEMCLRTQKNGPIHIQTHDIKYSKSNQNVS